MTKTAFVNQQWRMWGMWEPKMFLQRRGDGAVMDVDALWDECHSDKMIERMKTLGINLCHIHFHKGYGLEHERESIAEAANFAGRLHLHGIRVGTYIGCTFFTETFRHPRLDEMLTQNGHSGWSGSQYFRKHWCYNSPVSQEYFKEVIRIAIEEVDADVLHFDHSWSFVQDRLCHCKYCVEGFHRYLCEGNPELVGIAGYERAGLIEPPPPGNGAYLATVKEMREPGAMGWLLYHADAGVEAMRSLVEHARNLKPDVGIFFNPACFCGITPFAYASNDFEKLALADMAGVEDSLENPVGVTEDGMPVSRFRAYKAGLRTRCRIMCYTVEHGRRNTLLMAEAAAFSYASLGCLGMVQQKNHLLTEPADEKMLRYLVDCEHLFVDREPWHHVAVLRHHRSEILNPFPCALSPYVVEQMLFERHIPFAIIHQGELRKDILSREFDILILPDCKCLSDVELMEIERFVENGGRLLSIGMTATATPNNQFRPAWGLGKIFNRQLLSNPCEVIYEEIAASQTAMRADVKKNGRLDASFGNGRAIHLPPLKFHQPAKDEVHTWFGYPWFYHPYWRSPSDVQEFDSAMSELVGDRWRVRTNAPRHVGMEFFRIENGFRVFLINYSPNVTKPFKLAIRTGSARRTGKVFWESPELSTEILWHEEEGAIVMEMPQLNMLGILTLNEDNTGFKT